MEGRYTKIGAIAAIFALLIPVWQIIKEKTESFEGEWLMHSKIEKENLSSYIGLTIECKLYLTQNDKSIDIKGVVNGNVFTLKYVENGKKERQMAFLKVN